MLFAPRAVAAAMGAVLSLGAVRAADIPRPSPEFAVNMLGGKHIQLSQYRGKVVAMLFILTYCPHCHKTVQALSRFQTEYGPRGFQAVGSAIEDMASLSLPEYLNRHQPTFPVGYNERPPVIGFLQHPSMLRLLMPQIVFIDRQGVIRAQYSGDDKFFGDDQDANIRRKIEELLGPVNSNGARKVSRPASRARAAGKK